MVGGMALRDLVLKSQLIPPQPRKGILRRPRVQVLLSSVLDYPLTLVLAGTGYGKSTALADLARLDKTLFWYSVTEPDHDPLLFLIHLISAFGQHDLPYGEEALHALEENGGRASPAALTPLLNDLTAGLNSDAILVIDDYHIVHEVNEIGALVRQLINYRPPHLHIVIASRQMPEHLDLTRWRIKGEMVTITHSDLAFTKEEIETLFREQFGVSISRQQVQRLASETDGWALALQMVWQSMQRGAGLDGVLARLPATLENLFDYLAPEVLARQPQEIQRFLVKTSILRQLGVQSCNALLDRQDSEGLLRRLHEGGMFIDSIGAEAYRYQRLFQEFLQTQLSTEDDQARDLHRRAAEYFTRAGQPEESIYHLLEAGDKEAASELIEQVGGDMVRSGRLDSLMGWIKRLPEELRAARPVLKLLMGDVFRLRADFDAALEHYSAAEQLYARLGDGWGRSRALRGQSQVYLDTIRPLKADALLEEALRLLEPQEYRQEVAALLDQLAENKLNLGFPEQAQLLHREARLLRAETSPNDVYLEGRALLRTGRLVEARQLLMQQADEERQAGSLRPQRFHRETLLLLSLVCSMLGNGVEAEQFAREGIEIGRRLQSEFVEAVGFMRLGHALQINDGQPWNTRQREEAAHYYQRSIEQVHPFKVARVGVEPLWGLCRAYGFGGDIFNAEQRAIRALEISELAGDEWIGNLVRTSMGASLVMAGQAASAQRWLERAAEGFQRVGDPYGWTAAMAWQALNAWWNGNPASTVEIMASILPAVQESGHEMLLTRPTLIGLKDEQVIIPLLLETRQHGVEVETANRLLNELRVVECEYHPGYTLWVRTLGAFGVWRGDSMVSAHEWQREKARQLFQLLITNRKQWLPREQIVDRLWPELPPEAAARNFKVALNALNRALEPARPRSAQPFFVVRSDTAYGINPAARVVVDVDVFERLLANPGENGESGGQVQQALGMYEGDYLPDCRYEDWAAGERERLQQVFLEAAGRMAAWQVNQQAWDEVIGLCNTTLMRDNCWEPGYRYLMQAYAGKSNLAMVQNTYNRCAAILHEELGVDPSAETRALLRRLTVG